MEHNIAQADMLAHRLHLIGDDIQSFIEAHPLFWQKLMPSLRSIAEAEGILRLVAQAGSVVTTQPERPRRAPVREQARPSPT